MNRAKQTNQDDSMNNNMSEPTFTFPLDEEDRGDSSSSNKMMEDVSIMAVRPNTVPMGAMNNTNPSPPCLPVAPFVIPQRHNQPLIDENDDISVLTEFSVMDTDEEDTVSQVTARTVVTTNTTGTDSTTIPRRNISQIKAPQPTKRRHGMLSMKGVPHDNHLAKRRRKL